MCTRVFVCLQRPQLTATRMVLEHCRVSCCCRPPYRYNTVDLGVQVCVCVWVGGWVFGNWCWRLGGHGALCVGHCAAPLSATLLNALTHVRRACPDTHTHTQQGIGFLIQSDKFSAAHLCLQVEAFVRHSIERLSTLPEVCAVCLLRGTGRGCVGV
jgi:hypothetical protein